MKSLIVTVLVVGGLALSGVPAFAQTTSLSVPVAVVKDADGKVVAQIGGLGSLDYPIVFLNVDGAVVRFTLRPLEGRLTNEKMVYFSEPGCTGQAQITPPQNSGWDSFNQTSYEVVGPLGDEGTYKVIRSTSPATTVFFPLSSWSNGDCDPASGQVVMAPAEEVLPNPLEGFHGPTAANPERVWTIEGGDRLP